MDTICQGSSHSQRTRQRKRSLLRSHIEDQTWCTFGQISTYQSVQTYTKFRPLGYPVLPTRPQPLFGRLGEGGFQQFGSGTSLGSLVKFYSMLIVNLITTYLYHSGTFKQLSMQELSMDFLQLLITCTCYFSYLVSQFCKLECLRYRPQKIS